MSSSDVQVSNDVTLQLLLITLASKGDSDTIKELLDEDKLGIDLNEGDYDARTALHLACEEGHAEVVKVLLDHGANVNVIDRWGNTPLKCAIRHNENTIASMLKDRGGVVKIESDSIEGKLSKVKSLDKAYSLRQATKMNEKIEHTRAIFDEIAGRSDADHLNEDQIVDFVQRTRGIYKKFSKPFRDSLKAFMNDRTEVPWNQYLDLLLDSGDSSEGAVQDTNACKVLRAIFTDKLAVPNWEKFTQVLVDVYDTVKENVSGEPASYIPELAEVNADLFAVCVVTVDGQLFRYGDWEEDFTLQSTSKPMLYSFCVESIGYDEVHKWVGKEPSGREFNAFTLNYENKAHNACINAGAIVVCSLYHPELQPARKFKMASQQISQLAGDQKIGFSQSVYLSEKGSANRNFALSYFLASKGGFPPYQKIEDALDFYFQCCSTEVNCFHLATIASTFANFGINPLSGNKVLSFATVRSTMQLAFSCGMYDYSGEWACTVGLPAKSGVSGSIFLVIPGVLGMAVFSPRLDMHGNSVRGVEFATRIVNRFGWNIFDVLYAAKDHQ